MEKEIIFTSLQLPSLHLGFSRGVVGAGVVLGLVRIVYVVCSELIAVVVVLHGVI